jgi:predicted aminopeptidase
MQYYAQAVKGHTEILTQEESIEGLLDSSDLNPDLREILSHSQEARDFAVSELGLPDNDSYRNFVVLDRDYVVWNVVATDEFSVKPEQWCFLVVGCISYKGYYDRKQAEQFARELREKGHDVYLAGVRAYSTIGWFDDPLLSTMLYQDEARRIGIIFHELAHQQLYIKGDSAFNEAFAMTVEIEGVKRWLRSRNQAELLERYEESLQRKWIFNRLLNDTREQLKAIYAQSISVDEKRLRKQQAFDNLKRGYEQARQDWGGYDGYDNWMAQDLNNAHLSQVATYYDLIPAFQGLLTASDHDFRLFYQKAEDIGDKDEDERAEDLAHYAQEGMPLLETGRMSAGSSP